MNGTEKRPLIRAFLEAPLSGPQIEEKSLAIIDAEAPANRFTEVQWPVVRRMIHTTGDFSIMEAVRFSPEARKIFLYSLALHAQWVAARGAEPYPMGRS